MRGARPRRNCSRARKRRSPRRRPSSSTPAGLEEVNEDLSELSEKETEFLPITTKAYLYLSGTPFKALATGEFIEEQIFNWTYTDEQRAKEEFAAKNPGKWNPYGALPQMRLLTYQMPDELLAIASAGEFDEFDLNEFFAASGTGAKARSSSTRATCRSGWTSSGASTRRRRSRTSRRARGRRFRIRTCACCPISSTRSGFCPTSRPVTRWRTCWPRSTTPSGTSTRSSSPPVRRRASGWMRCRPCARPSGAASRPRPSRSRAASSPPASPCRSGHPS